jgi:hypothetical protein
MVVKDRHRRLKCIIAEAAAVMKSLLPLQEVESHMTEICGAKLPFS